MTNIERYTAILNSGEALTRREQRRQTRHQDALQAAFDEVDGRALLAIATTNAQAAIEANKIRRVISLHKVALSEITSYSQAEALAMELAPASLHRIGAIGSRLVIEIDEALDDGSHKLTGRGQ